MHFDFGRTRKTGDPMQERIDCLVGAGATVVGDLTFTGGLRIDGRVEGDVRVSHLVVFGRVTGSIYATGLVDLRGHAHIAGNVHYGAIEMQKGAVIEGHLIRHKAAGGLQ